MEGTVLNTYLFGQEGYALWLRADTRPQNLPPGVQKKEEFKNLDGGGGQKGLWPRSVTVCVFTCVCVSFRQGNRYMHRFGVTVVEPKYVEYSKEEQREATEKAKLQYDEGGCGLCVPGPEPSPTPTVTFTTTQSDGRGADGVLLAGGACRGLRAGGEDRDGGGGTEALRRVPGRVHVRLVQRMVFVCCVQSPTDHHTRTHSQFSEEMGNYLSFDTALAAKAPEKVVRLAAQYALADMTAQVINELGDADHDFWKEDVRKSWWRETEEQRAPGIKALVSLANKAYDYMMGGTWVLEIQDVHIDAAIAAEDYLRE